MESNDIILSSTIVIGVTWVIYYFVIKAAVGAANAELLDQLKSSNALQIMQMKKQGFDLEELRTAGGYYREMNKIEKRKDYMGVDAYRIEKLKLEQLYQ